MVGEAPRIDRFYLELGGKGRTLQAEKMQALRSVRVEDDLAQPRTAPGLHGRSVRQGAVPG